jgi:peroxiredoxin
LYYALQLQGHRLSPEGGEALALLRRDHLTSPKMALYIEQLSRCPWVEFEPLLREVLERNPDRTDRGHACLGLAMMIAHRATLPKLANDPATARGLEEVYGKERLDEVLRQDVAASLEQATALYERVLSEFAEVKYFPDLPDDKSTLAPHAEGWLTGRSELAIGTPAPEIEGQDVDGKVFKLSDYRGKVVALVFWATWCGPCMAQIPHERELVRKMEGRPFALLGVNCDHKPGEARAALAKEKITWPNWYDGDPGEGKIAERYHIHTQGIPAVFVLDANGIIREKDVRGEALDRAIEALLGEQEAKIAK